MIKKERLEQLIKQEATIWKVPYGTPIETKLHKLSFVGNKLNLKEDYLMEYSLKNCDYIMSGILSQLFETKEDAEEYVEFGNITKTEKLPYVSWEKFKNKEGNYSFKVYPYDYYCYTDGRYVRIKQYYGSLDRIVFTKPLTRENYNEARRLCIKLFKGEEV